jgi:cytochrome b involved in lipid metabolism
MAIKRHNSTPVSRKEAILSRRVIEGLIADGRKVIVVDGKVLKVDAWLKYHPGGDKAIMHMIGRDATDEVNACVEAPLWKISEINWLIVKQAAFT